MKWKLMAIDVWRHFGSGDPDQGFQIKSDPSDFQNGIGSETLFGVGHFSMNTHDKYLNLRHDSFMVKYLYSR